MACYILIFALLFFSWAPFLALAQPFKAVNLGNWLVTEGWMKPSLYDGIPNNDLLDGTQVQFLSTKLQKYLSSENGGGTVLVANRPSASGWETFRLWRFNETHFNLRVFNKQFVGLEDQGNKVTAVSDTVGNSQTFQIIRNNDDRNLVRLQTSNGQFIQASSETVVTADYVGSGWNDSDPSVFKMTIVNSLQGEYQLTNGYGPERAPQVLQDHWNSYITEEDFRFMSENSLNAVRIPVGWWIASDPTPPKPFVGGSLKALDNAFTWAQKYGMKEWGESNIQETVAVIDFLAERYADKPGLAAIELMNEPMAPGVNLDTLKKYYQAGYDAVRKHSENAYVILSNRLGPADSKELLSFASGLKRVVIDVHYYNLFSDSFNSMNPQQNIEYIYNQRASALATVTTTNGPLSFIGEWTGEWAVSGSINARLPELRQGSTGCVWACHIWMGILGLSVCSQPLESQMDD
ncbi:GLUCAN 13-BETA-GLUCOSIDASE-RELATED [Salix viminalis]|uniref:GLUCAN 13-BETA-GLUCOSIDASE-RELATED n=1 Tax=Salix viminalis TaxID=40686 RepID=A0A9Q0NXX8_SALVM|nr:GLUCAN 13-BETA-GLUCOSIDASE-RELATED [Salix viminalis]